MTRNPWSSWSDRGNKKMDRPAGGKEGKQGRRQETEGNVCGSVTAAPRELDTLLV